MSKNLFEEIAEYLVKTVQEESDSSMSGFQYVISNADVQEKFGMKIDEYINDKIMEASCEREEIADICIDTDGYDVVLYTDFAPNYIEELWD
ncbi:TPA: hypothetical protein ACXDAY_002299 [Clostridium botulinum]|uniref:hypothetical protein n=1 Tax=Clostridium botulinum TaxID=1491 RepID=UPI000773C94A|nr:hypothetical protein [Clostridium botulinum]AUN01413.1 hypothetical protein RSJ19_00080 [Clostridium botulinum]MBN3359391.1 hypothetical protein [Clostridium botulinum]MBN3367219.1 hypothetical protein [Clostridium botulinum]MBN3371603.1 hypothetical protein [Clostridium botulinum]MBN3376548.1 hypothetical protein [Clostridium botulinum]